ncbi:hypothetical protein [Nitrosospira sp. NpAV]|uniref:hypothetical protein n=1 Tax=Nitrosospira sp. NpAV TaxID=58133 RepID=UPI0005A1E4C3|nr:hypothetical protein [Nitrosospira sp. NpAV]KIO48294.1 hypothetical protein SQ11_12545 [Nitrosospira sp. NpAV]
MATQKFTLVENALDSLEHAILHLNDMPKALTAGTFKRIILDLSHVAELLFKERLRQVHPAFVLADVDKYPSMTAHTVTAADALKRLQRIGSVEFNDSDQSALKTIREKRNEIEHYAFSIDEAEAKVVIGSVLAFIFRFATDEVGLDWADRRINDPAWKRLNQFAEFYEIEKARVLAALEDGEIPIMECPLCSNETFDMEAEVCVLCGHREPVLECKACKADYLYSKVEYEDAGLCPKCEWKDGYATAHCEKY